MNLRNAIPILVFFIIIIIVRIRDYESLFTGFWVADEHFLIKAGLKDMYLFIGPYKDYRRCYLIIVGEDGNIIKNSGMSMTYNKYSPINFGNVLKSYFVGLTNSYNINSTMISNKSTNETKFIFNPVGNTLTMHDNNKIIGFFNRGTLPSN